MHTQHERAIGGVLTVDRRRWAIVAIIFLAIVFNYFDRQIVSILKPLLKREYGLADPDYAIVVNIFTVFYALMYMVSGWLVDRFGPRRVMLYGIAGWALACIGGGLARSFGQFVFFRGMLGAAEPSNFTAQLRVVTVWFPSRLRATANSLCVAGSSVGAIIAPPLIAWITIRYGWHSVFLLAGGVGLVIAALWSIIYREPPPTAEHDSDLMVDEAGAGFAWGELWTRKSLWGILLIRFISDPVWYFCLFWLPGYLQESSGLSLSKLGMVGWIPFLAADLGAIGTAAWSDRMVRQGKPPLRARKLMLTTVGVLAPLCILTPYLPSARSTLVIFSFVAIACLSWVFTLPVVIAEVFPVKNVGSVLGIAGGFGAAGAVGFNYFVGQMIGTLGASKVFLLMGCLHPIAIFLLWRMVRKEVPTDH